MDEHIISSVSVTIATACLIITAIILIKLTQVRKYINSRKKELSEKSIEEILTVINAEHIEIQAKIKNGRMIASELFQRLDEVSEQIKHINVGLIPPTFEITDSESLKQNILNARDKQFELIQRGAATDSYTDWTWFGSKADGAKMVNDYCLLLLKAFNAEFEAIRKAMRVKTYDTAVQKIRRSMEQLAKLGETTNVSIAYDYYRLKIEELTIWHNELQRIADQKAERAKQQALLREQRKLDTDDSEEIDEELSIRESELRKAQRLAEKMAGQERAKLELQIEKIKQAKLELEEKLARATSQAQMTK